MTFKVGRLSFVNEDYFKFMVKLGILAPYDCSPGLRERHNREIIKKYNRMTDEERREEWSKVKFKEKSRSLKLGEKVSNPWL